MTRTGLVSTGILHLLAYIANDVFIGISNCQIISVICYQSVLKVSQKKWLCATVMASLGAIAYRGQEVLPQWGPGQSPWSRSLGLWHKPVVQFGGQFRRFAPENSF